MALEKIAIRNSAGGTVTALVISLLMVMGIFFGAYLYFEDNVNSAGLTIDSKYSDAYGNLSESQDELDENIQDIKTSLDNVKEATTVVQVAWNGLKGLGSTIKLPITFVSTSLSAFTAIMPTTDILPGWANTIIFIGISAFVVFLIVKVLKGEPNM